MIARYFLRALPAVALATGLLAGFGAPQADARSTCTALIDRAEAKLSNDIYHHGRYSYQANNDRTRLARVHELCDVPAPPPAQTRAYAQPYAGAYRSAYPPPPPPPPAPYRAPYYAAPYPPYPAPPPYYRGY